MEQLNTNMCNDYTFKNNDKENVKKHQKVYLLVINMNYVEIDEIKWK